MFRKQLDLSRVSIYLLAFVLLTSNFVVLNGFDDAIVTKEKTRQFNLSYTPHGAIFITGNQDFIDQGWSGNGSESDPYRIEGLNITSTQVCIDIRYVDVHFCRDPEICCSESAIVRFWPKGDSLR